jgi:hypothetical protein
VNLGGLNIIFTENALEATTERLFPESKHRSKRIYKKLMKRFGGEFRKRPCMWKAGGVVYAHPSFRTQIQAALTKNSDTNSTSAGSMI